MAFIVDEKGGELMVYASRSYMDKPISIARSIVDDKGGELMVSASGSYMHNQFLLPDLV